MPEVLLGEVARERKETCKEDKSGYPIVGLEHLTPEEITLDAWDKGGENTFTRFFRKGDVLFGRRRAYLKKAASAPFDGICSGDITVIEAIPGRVLPELLPFIIQNDALFDFAVEKSAGSLSPRVKWTHLKNYEFELPDMDKQHELAELLWAMDATKKSYQRLIAATDDLVKSQFIEMFGHVDLNDKGWPVIAFEEAFFVKSSKRIYAKELQTIPDVPFLKVADLISLIDNGKCNPKTFISQERFDELTEQDETPSFGDILLTSRGTIGKCYIVGDERFYFQDGMISWLKPKSTQFLPEFIVTMFGDSSFGKILNGAINKTTVTYISLEKLAKLPLIVPSIETQEQFIGFMHQSDKSKFEMEQALSELTATYKRIIAENLN